MTEREIRPAGNPDRFTEVLRRLYEANPDRPLTVRDLIAVLELYRPTTSPDRSP